MSEVANKWWLCCRRTQNITYEEHCIDELSAQITSDPRVGAWIGAAEVGHRFVQARLKARPICYPVSASQLNCYVDEALRYATSATSSCA